MLAMRCRDWGGPEVLQPEDVALPPLQPHEARIRVRTCGINFADTLIIAGKYQLKPALPFTPGFEAAGEVIEIGGAVAHLKPGQRVFAYLRGGGGYAEEAIADAAAMRPIPEGMDWATAGGFVVAYTTAHYALVQRGNLRPGETLLVLGAAGAVGLTAIEVGKLLGARVIAAAGGPEKLAVARQQGADELIDYRQESIRDRVRELTQGGGVDVVYDPVGGDAFDEALRVVNWGARMLVIGFAAGRIQSVPANLVLVKGISVVGVDRGAQARRDPSVLDQSFAELLGWWEAGRLKPYPGEVFPLADAGKALAAMTARRYAGKLLLQT